MVTLLYTNPTYSSRALGNLRTNKSFVKKQKLMCSVVYVQGVLRFLPITYLDKTITNSYLLLQIARPNHGAVLAENENISPPSLLVRAVLIGYLTK